MTRLTGGCQCGAVRFACTDVVHASICHCRMCQKALGGPFGAFSIAGNVEWTRGGPKRYASSNVARRGFCADCGTPLTYEWADEVCLTLGAFDDPNVVVPTVQLAPEMRVKWFDAMHQLPLRAPREQAIADAAQAKVVSNQHPDHDTAEWPPKHR